MNIDEFLVGEKTIGNIGKNTIIKIQYNENIDFLYKPSYGEFQYGNELYFLGLFEKITKKLYGSSLDFQSNYDIEMNSKYYESSIGKIEENITNGANMYLNKYVEENKTTLMNIGKEIFDKYISDDWNYSNIKNNIIKDYINDEQNHKFSLSINSYHYEKNIKDLIIKYIQNPKETTKGIFKEYINNSEKIESIYFNDHHNNISVKEHLGAVLLETQLRNTLLQELKDNPNNEYKKKRDIISSIKELDAQMVTITLKHNNEMITLKYPRNILEQMELYEWNIPDLKIRWKIGNLYKNIYGQEKDDTFIKEIAKIEYKKRTIYEDTKLLSLENNLSNNIEETHDIVDDMFD